MLPVPFNSFTQTLPRRTRQAFRWDTRAGMLSGIYQGMTLPFFGVLARRMGASEFEVAVLIAAPFIGHLLSMFVACHMQNRPKKPYMVWIGIVARTLFLLMFLAGSKSLFIVLVGVSQIIGTFTIPAYAAIMKDVYPEEARGRLMGLVRVGATSTAMISGLFTGYLLEKGLPFWPHPISYQILFPIGGLIGILALLAFNRLPEGEVEQIERPSTVIDGLLTFVRDRPFALYSIAFFTFGFGNLLQVPLIPLFQVDVLDIPNSWVGILAMVTAGTSAVFYAFWGRLMDRHSPFMTVIASFIIWGISPFVYAVAHTVPTLIFASLLVGIASPGIDLSWLNAAMQFADRESVPRYAALHTFLVGIRGLLAPIVGTAMFKFFQTQQNSFTPGIVFRQCFYVSAAVIWLGALMMIAVVWLVLIPQQRRKQAAVPATAG